MLSRQICRSSRAALRHSRPISLQQHASSPYSSIASLSLRSQHPPSYQLSRRWQSTEAAKDASTSTSSDAKTTDTSPPSPEDALKQEIEKHKKEVVDLKDKYLRSVADYRNLQDRTARDNANARNFAIQKFAADLLDSVDNLDRALGAVPEAALGKSSGTTTSNTSSADPNVAAPSESTVSEPNKDLLNLYNGLKMTEQILMQVLKKHGLERFDPLEGGGRKFDPNLDEATFFTKVEGKPDGEVFYTQSKGYTLNGRVIRASKVGVVKNS